jgi:hypothetical protein
MLKIRNEYNELIADTSPESYEVMDFLPDGCLGFFRKEKAQRKLALIVNNNKCKTEINIPGKWSCLRKVKHISDKFLMRGKRIIVMKNEE